jgi:hypothetical protein
VCVVLYNKGAKNTGKRGNPKKAEKSGGEEMKKGRRAEEGVCKSRTLWLPMEASKALLRKRSFFFFFL